MKKMIISFKNPYLSMEIIKNDQKNRIKLHLFTDTKIVENTA